MGGGGGLLGGITDAVGLTDYSGPEEQQAKALKAQAKANQDAKAQYFEQNAWQNALLPTPKKFVLAQAHLGAPHLFYLLVPPINERITPFYAQ